MGKAIRLVVSIGEGLRFCAGDDLNGYNTRPQVDHPLMRPIEHGHDSPIGTYNVLRTISQAVNRKIRELDKLSIAAING